MQKLTLKQRKALILMLLLLWLLLLVQGCCSLYSFFSRYRLFKVASGSMEPTLPTGAVIVVAKNNGSLYSPGDIITYKQNDLYITHRVLETGYQNGFYYRTQGDANQEPDAGLVKHQAVIGRVILIAPGFVATLQKLFRVRSLLLLHVLFLAALYLNKQRKTAVRRPLHN
ncbi:MAG: signal peptidase I [Dethiobacteraceae bacterium]|jgi:signal peptidase|nr:signal peptidase I [Bacillota bacterium]